MAYGDQQRWRCDRISLCLVLPLLLLRSLALNMKMEIPDYLEVVDLLYARTMEMAPTDTTAGVSIFYHLYVKDISAINRVTDIVLEQFQWLRSSVHSHVYVNSIGVALPRLANLTNASQVVVKSQQTSGSEMITLNDIWLYCDSRPNNKVVYLHSKGSFHKREENDRLRHVLSYSSLSSECTELPDTCDVCSWRMSPFPHAHTPGNMWLARCSYINKLLKPDDFLEKMGEEDNNYYGSGRFAAEHWVHSHPSVRPCDLFSSPSYVYGYKHVPLLDELISNLELGVAPRFNLSHTLKQFEGRRILKSYPAFPERLAEYKMLYGVEEPDPQWWGWDFFDAKSKGNYTFPPRLFNFGNSPKVETTKPETKMSSDLFPAETSETTETTTTGVSIFYHLYVKDASEIARVTDIVLDQFQWLRSSVHSHVYVNSIGTAIPSLPSLTNASQVVLNSQQESGSEMITLNDLWQFCASRPTAKVVYLHSKGSFHQKEENDRLRRVLSFGALSTECTELPDTCDVCSWRMSPFPNAHTPGNMFLVRCSYVNKLLGPDEFLEKMGTEDSTYYGSGRFAAEHWVHSHPSVRPCDLFSSPSYVYGYKHVPLLEELKANLKLDMAPRYNLSHTLKQFEGRRILKSYPSFGDRLAEYKTLYGVEKPDPSWWGWDFFNATSKGNYTYPPRLFNFDTYP